ncbi:hypothetical protein G3M48_000222 [Beauveria asiatica]|uniref:DUF7924 domain-containing protein n=1 Tax=Beauveria asiatica TaxID=1069075 RepID=A0AAW0S133_9HYPO
MSTLMQHAPELIPAQWTGKDQLVTSHSSPDPHQANRVFPRPIISSFYAPAVSIEAGANRKRPNPYDTTQDSPPAKRVKPTSTVRIASDFPPQFWDSLLKVWLTPRALREKDRRNGARPPATTSPAPTAFTATTLARFARRGGPDLRHLRGGKVMADILPIIRGNTNIPNKGNLPFANLDSITDGITVDAVPDLYDGSHSIELHKTVRQDLGKTVIPTSHGRAPVAPNFFVEAKAPRGGADVAKRQACLDGAVGARAMHSLQNYGEDEPVYDGNAHTYSSTYHNGQLMLYAHHLTAPTADGERPEYHMTQIDTWGMTGNIETFRRGAAAFRNARELARGQRERLIQTANARMSQAQEVATEEQISEVQDIQHTNAYVHHSETTAWQDFHDDLQQQIANTYVEDREDDGGAPTPEHQYSSDESLDLGRNPAAPGCEDPSMSFVSNLTSSSSTTTTRPKRSRRSLSSPNESNRFSKSRSRATARHQSFTPPVASADLEFS